MPRPGRALLPLLLVACSAPAPREAAPAVGGATPGAVAAAPPIPDTVATIGAEAVTRDQLLARLGTRLDELDARYLRARQRALDEALDAEVRDRLFREATTRTGQPLDRLLEEALGAPLEPGEADVTAAYAQFREQLGGRPLADVRGELVAHLRTERRGAAADRLAQRLAGERKVERRLGPFRHRLVTDGRPSLGPDAAPVTLVVFSDFQCPFCARAVPTVHQVHERYGDTVRIVFKQLPIADRHPDAPKAAEASLCAHEQGKFWALHDAMFRQQDRLQVPALKELAGRTGLDRAAFDACLDSGRHARRVMEDAREAQPAGVTGTPAFFVNGAGLPSGAQPFEVLAAAIDRELSRRR